MTTLQRSFLVLGAAGACLGATGCDHVGKTATGPIVGLVRYPAGTVAVHAGVRVAGGTDYVFTGPTRSFTLPVAGLPGDTVVVVATDACDGHVHASTNSGSSRVVLRRSPAGTVIVLSESTPI